jgi:hypothetical protein
MSTFVHYNKREIMKNNRLLIILLSVLLCGALTGCGDRPVDTKSIEVGKLRHEIFKECMSLASANQRNSDDDVADIVESCNSYSYYIAKQQLDY